MKHTEHTIHSAALDRDLHVQVYGEAGHPVIAFPTAGGNAADWEANGMVDAVAELIESGRMQLFAVDAADDASWLAGGDIDPRGAAQEAYDQFVVGDLLAFVKKTNGSDERPLVAGVDLGAAHAMLALLRWPEYFEGAVAMSGIYDAKYYTAGRLNSDWYNNSAVDFMANLPADHPYVDLLRQRFIVVAAGQGAGEEASLSTQRALDTRFAQLGLGAWFDYWGGDVTHDWSWWTKMAAYFLPTALDHYAKPAPKPAAKAATAKPAPKPAAKAAAAKPASKPAAKAATAKPAAKAAPKVAPAKKAEPKPATKTAAPAKPAAKKAEPVKKAAPKPAAKSAPAKKAEPKPAAAAKSAPVAKPAAKPAPAKKAAFATKTADKVATKPAMKKAVAPAKAETAAKPVAAKKTESKPAATAKSAPAAKPAPAKKATAKPAAKLTAKAATPAKPATKPAAAKPAAAKPAAKPAAVKKPATVKSAAKKTRKK